MAMCLFFPFLCGFEMHGNQSLVQDQPKRYSSAHDLYSNVVSMLNAVVAMWLHVLQVVEWLQLLAERGTDSAGFKSTGFERFERVWTGQQVGPQLLGPLCTFSGKTQHPAAALGMHACCGDYGDASGRQCYSTHAATRMCCDVPMYLNCCHYLPVICSAWLKLPLMLLALLLQMLSALAEAGLGMQEVEHLWAVYERARAAEEKAGFNTGARAAASRVSLCKGPCRFGVGGARLHALLLILLLLVTLLMLLVLLFVALVPPVTAT
jgi:hypothetical protein